MPSGKADLILGGRPSNSGPLHHVVFLGVIMPESIHSYEKQLPGLARELAAHGSMALLLLDVSAFVAIEEQYGTQTYKTVRQNLFKLLEDQAGKEFRKEDILALDEPLGVRILLFLERRRKTTSDVYQGLESLRQRLTTDLMPQLERTAQPYLKNPPPIAIGFGVALHNPLLDPSRIIFRAIREALKHADWHRQKDEMDTLRRLSEIVLHNRIITAYQPIIGMRDGKVLAFEALSRGAPGTGLQQADQLFAAAIKYNYLVEIDRVCRSRAFICSDRLPKETKLFVNTLPATIRDPEFKGQHLVSFLEQTHMTPDRIVIEITEKLVIDNLSLFQEAMSYYTDLGMALAVDDVGSGYSGLETIAQLKPAYLKADASLVRGVSSSLVNREMLKAIVGLGHGIGAKVIAEGIQTVEEMRTIEEIGADYGQGFYLGRPEVMSLTGE
jgi:EAL domain-containing protein (putative c-di-GMP-specific phosphodiesterase class I)